MDKRSKEEGSSNSSGRNQRKPRDFLRGQVEASLGKELSIREEEQKKKTDNQASMSRSVGRDKQKVEDQKPSQEAQIESYQILKRYGTLLEKVNKIDENAKKEIIQFWRQEINDAKNVKHIKEINEHIKNFIDNNGVIDLSVDRSKSVNKCKQKIEYQESSQNYDNKGLTTQFNVRLGEYYNYVIEEDEVYNNLDEHHKNILVYLCKKQFFEAKDENEQKKYVEGLIDDLREKYRPNDYDSEQKDIDDKLGNILKDKKIDLKKAKESIDKFLKEKAKDKSDKKATIRTWATEIGTYLFNNSKLMNTFVYNELYKHVQGINNKQGDNQSYRQNNRQQSNQDRLDLLAELGDEGVRRQGEMLRDYENNQWQQQWPERTYGQQQWPERTYGQQQWPERTYGQQQRPERTYGQQQRPERANRQEHQPERGLPNLEQRLADLRARGLRRLTTSQLREYSEILLQQQELRHGDQQGRVEVRNEAHQLREHLRSKLGQLQDYMAHPDYTRIDYGPYESATDEQQRHNIERAIRTTDNILQALQDDDPRQRQRVPEQRLADLRARSLRRLTTSQLQEYSEILLQQQELRHGDQQGRVEVRNEAHQLREHLRSKLGQLQDYMAHPDYTRIDYGPYESTTDEQQRHNIERAIQTTDNLLRVLQDDDPRQRQRVPEQRHARPRARDQRPNDQRRWRVQAKKMLKRIFGICVCVRPSVRE